MWFPDQGKVESCSNMKCKTSFYKLSDNAGKEENV